MDPAKPLSEKELEILRNNPELEGIIPEVMVRRLIATIDLLRLQLPPEYP